MISAHTFIRGLSRASLKKIMADRTAHKWTRMLAYAEFMRRQR